MPFFLPQHIREQMLKKLKPQSVKLYDKWIFKYVFNDKGKYNKNKLINFHKKITPEFKLNKLYTSILSAIEAVLKAEGLQNDAEIYRNFRIAHVSQDIEFYKKPTQRDIDNKIDIDEILKLKEQKQQLYNNKPTLYNSYHLQFLKLITEIPPLRSEDYFNTSFQNIEGYNYCDLDNKVIHFKNGKSINSIRDIKLGDELTQFIRKTKDKFNSRWLFPSLRDRTQPMNSKSFNKWLARLFGKNVSTSMLRRVFISHWKDEDMPKDERIEKAKQMGHTLAVSEKHYTKYSKKIHDKDELIEKQRLIIKKKDEIINNLTEIIKLLKQK